MLKKKEEIFKYLFVILSSALILVLSYFRIFDVFELQTLDLRFKARPQQKVNSDIVIIEIAEDSINKIGRWPFDRYYHALLIKALKQAQARQIIFDVLFSEKSPSDEYLVDATSKAKDVYFPYSFRLNSESKGEISAAHFEAKPVKKLRQVAFGAGHINIVPDIDGKDRKVPVYIKLKGKYYPHLALKAASDYLGIKKENIEFKPAKYLKLNNSIKIPLNKRNEALINYAGKWGRAFKHYSYIDIVGSYLLKKQNKKPIIDLAELKDKVCFVGLTASGLSDLQAVPFARRYPGVGIHANFFNSITTNNFLFRLNRWANLIILASLCVVIIFLFKIKSVFKRLIYAVTILVIYILVSFLSFVFIGVWLDLFYPVLAAILLYLSLTVYRLIVERHRRELMEKELSVARRIQQSFLPLEPPTIKGLEIASSIKPVKEVGGDLYQFVRPDEKHLGVMVADVSGKGVPAALFMAKVTTEFKMAAAKQLKPNEVLSELNKQLLLETSSGLFVTVSYALIDVKTKEVELADAGHLPLILYRPSSDSIEEIRPAKGMPVGLMPEVEFNKEKFTLASGDILIFYTDGLTEARNTKGQEFGLGRIKKTIRKCSHERAAEILEYLKSELSLFSKSAPQHDDITLIVLRIK